MEMIESNVISCVAKSLAKKEADINLKSKIIKELGADSLDFMDIIFQLESAFNLKLKKDQFDFFVVSGLKKEEAVVEGKLSRDAKIKLKDWLPELPIDEELAPKDLANYLTIESLCLVISKNLPKA